MKIQAYRIATGYGLEVSDSIHGRCNIFLFVYSLHTDSGAHTVSYPMGTGLLPPGVKRLGR
jgi:hypothetical protein